MSDDPRQFILILTDTQGANVLGCYGRPELETPNLDGLAASGVRFDHAYTTCPLCTPARAAIFTGTYPHTNGAWGNEVPLGSDIVSVSRRLHDQGVHAAYVGKWHLSATDYFDTGEAPHGWDPQVWYDGRDYLEEVSEDILVFSRSRRTPQEIRAFGWTEEMTFAHRCIDRAMAFLAEHAKEDYFLVVSLDEPHAPALAPMPFCERFADYAFDVGPARDDTLAGKPIHQQHWAAYVRNQRQAFLSPDGNYVDPAYFGCNSYADYEIGRLLRAIERHAPAALVLHTSDHGEMMHAHRLFGKGPAMYEPTTRIPLIVRWSGKAPERTVCSEAVSQIDLTPTVLDFFGISTPPFLQGTSLLGAFRAPAAYQGRPVVMEFGRHSINNEFFGGFLPIRCIQVGDHKLVVNLLTTDELYDLSTDPHELYNRIVDPDYAETRESLHEQLIQWMRQTRDPFRGPAWERRHWHAETAVRWFAQARHRPEDGYQKPVLDYATGKPANPTV